MTDRHTLLYTNPPTILADLPPGITRSFIPTPSGPLELLSAQPTSSTSPTSPTSSTSSTSPPPSPRKRAILFQHGGFSSAAVFLPFLSFFSQHGHPCYALSLRGHGASWKPGFFSMVWLTGKKSLAQDLGYAFTWICGFETGQRRGMGMGMAMGDGEEDVNIVLVGHSAGGGLCQYFLGRGLGNVGGLVILAGFPDFGGLGVYYNWFHLDPYFFPRYYIRDLWHPRSPLSSTLLVHRAFFSPSFPKSEVQNFERGMPEFESMLWPLGMMFPFVNVRNVLRSIVGWDSKHARAKVMVVAGGEDRLMGVWLMERMAKAYRGAWAKILRTLRADSLKDGDDSEGRGVEFKVIEGSGHHLQNDLQWEECAGRVLEFVSQL